MSDLINRQAAIDALNMLFKKQVTQFGYEGYEKADEKTQLVCDGISESIGCVLNLPSAQPKWIPVTERLPEEDLCTGYGRQYSESVLMTAHNTIDDEDIVDYGHTVDGRWFSDTTDAYIPDNWDVTAWQKLPEPWKGEQE